MGTEGEEAGRGEEEGEGRRKEEGKVSLDSRREALVRRRLRQGTDLAGDESEGRRGIGSGRGKKTLSGECVSSSSLLVGVCREEGERGQRKEVSSGSALFRPT